MANNKDAYYFNHDANARNDQKLLKCRMDLGLEGYGIYFCLIEILRETKTYEIILDYEVLVYELRTDKDKIKQVVENYDLFVVKDNLLYSKSLKRRLETLDNKRQAKVEAGRKGGASNAKAKVKHCLKSAKATVKQHSSIRTDKIRTDKIRTEQNKTDKNKYLDFVFLSKIEFGKLQEKFGEQGTTDRIKNLNNYGHQKHKKFKEYTSHYHTILTWEKNSDNKQKPVRTSKFTGLNEKDYREGAF